MRIKQDTGVFKPITIHFDTKIEAEEFFNIMDKVDSNYNASKHPHFTHGEREMIIHFSNALTNGIVKI